MFLLLTLSAAQGSDFRDYFLSRTSFSIWKKEFLYKNGRIIADSYVLWNVISYIIFQFLLIVWYIYIYLFIISMTTNHYSIIHSVSLVEHLILTLGRQRPHIYVSKLWLFPCGNLHIQYTCADEASGKQYQWSYWLGRETSKKDRTHSEQPEEPL